MNDEKKAIEVLKHCKDRNFSAFDKIYFDDGTNMCPFQAIETVLTHYKKQNSIIKNAIDYIQHNNKELKNYSEQEMLDWLYGLDKCCEIKEEN
jgi:hypothetical protein